MREKMREKKGESGTKTQITVLILEGPINVFFEHGLMKLSHLFPLQRLHCADQRSKLLYSQKPQITLRRRDRAATVYRDEATHS